jgi:hypothetical protein
LPADPSPIVSRPPEELAAQPASLPEQLVGRQREMLPTRRLLSMTRLLTLTGSGKTRLALETARDLVGTYPDGAWLVE